MEENTAGLSWLYFTVFANAKNKNLYKYDVKELLTKTVYDVTNVILYSLNLQLHIYLELCLHFSLYAIIFISTNLIL